MTCKEKHSQSTTVQFTRLLQHNHIFVTTTIKGQETEKVIATQKTSLPS